MSLFLSEAVRLSLLSFRGTVHIFHCTPTSWEFWPSLVIAFHHFLSQPTSIPLWLITASYSRLLSTLLHPPFKTGSGGGLREVPAPHKKSGLLIFKATAQARGPDPATMDTLGIRGGLRPDSACFPPPPVCAALVHLSKAPSTCLLISFCSACCVTAIHRRKGI